MLLHSHTCTQPGVLDLMLLLVRQVPVLWPSACSMLMGRVSPDYGVDDAACQLSCAEFSPNW